MTTHVKLSFVLLFMLFAGCTVTFDDGLNAYRNGEWQRAYEIFVTIQEDRSGGGTSTGPALDTLVLETEILARIEARIEGRDLGFFNKIAFVMCKQFMAAHPESEEWWHVFDECLALVTMHFEERESLTALFFLAYPDLPTYRKTWTDPQTDAEWGLDYREDDTWRQTEYATRRENEARIDHAFSDLIASMNADTSGAATRLQERVAGAFSEISTRRTAMTPTHSGRLTQFISEAVCSGVPSPLAASRDPALPGKFYLEALMNIEDGWVQHEPSQFTPFQRGAFDALVTQDLSQLQYVACISEEEASTRVCKFGEYGLHGVAFKSMALHFTVRDVLTGGVVGERVFTGVSSISCPNEWRVNLLSAGRQEHIYASETSIVAWLKALE